MAKTDQAEEPEVKKAGAALRELAEPPRSNIVGGEVEEESKPAEKPKPKTRIAFGITEDGASRLRAAYYNLPGDLRPRTFSDFIEGIVMAYTVELEQKYNDGKPFKRLLPGELPTGRPLKDA